MADETITDDRTTRDKATDVATTAREEARGVAGDARSEAGAVAAEAGTQARALADEARHALRQQASDGTSRAAGAVEQLAGRLRALADGNTDQAGELQRYARDLGDRLGGVAQRMQGRGIDGLADDLQSFARRRPGVFLAAAAGAGFAAGRLFRGAKADAESSSGDARVVPADPVPGPGVPLDEQQRAAELSGFRTEPRPAPAEPWGAR